MFTLLFLHIALMFTAVALHAGPQLLAVAAVRTGQLPAVGPIVRVWIRTAPYVSTAFGLGAGFGLATGIAFGYDLLAGWLVAAYVLFAASGAWSFLVTLPQMRRLAEEADGLGDLAGARALGADVARFDATRLPLVVGADLAFLVAIVFDMVVKPFA